ncbi:hypothetical protein LAZ67_3001802 [Cordylochernes scorpioides]|uniref:Uncharacterized protein n=1 Tax=Cordylochernes scorpioides TaxID=51811 RepID=A0ABY6K7E1_9ARAC|nr:hypothetical protein LAZ67_3001802 [Cordylochernes scorpioides]
MAASDMRNRRHVQLLLTWSTNAAHPVALDKETLQVTVFYCKYTTCLHMVQAMIILTMIILVGSYSDCLLL